MDNSLKLLYHRVHRLSYLITMVLQEIFIIFFEWCKSKCFFQAAGLFIHIFRSSNGFKRCHNALYVDINTTTIEIPQCIRFPKTNNHLKIHYVHLKLKFSIRYWTSRDILQNNRFLPKLFLLN